jgi:hypothetical protein
VQRDEAPPALKLPGFRLSRRTLFALAASVILTIGLTTFWAFRLQSKNQDLARQRQTEQSGWQDRVKALEQENRRLHEQTQSLQQDYESQLADLRRPQLNVPVFDVYSRESILRAGEQNEVNRITLPSSATSCTLILNGEGLAASPSYAIEILDQKQQTVWQGQGLKRGPDGNLVISLSQTFLTEGKYRLRLLGRRGGQARRVAEYLVHIARPRS